MKKSTTTYKPAIVVPAFKRERSLSRLLDTVNSAHYPSNDIHLIISLDHGACDDVKVVAKSFDFKWGHVQIIEHSTKLGLKDHIIKCADFALEYGSIIVLEEDLIVSRGFYNYAQKALNNYDGEDAVAGISLYAQRFNESAQLPFEPLQTEYSTYFMRLVCSWGQAWTYQQWKEFKEWFNNVDSLTVEKKNELPDNIKKWNNFSWKKFFNAYMQERDKYFVYPYSSLSTHCGDEKGENIKKAGNLFQVPLSGRDPRNDEYNFPEFENHPIKYDMYMESSVEYIRNLLDLHNKNIIVDLYGTKSLDQLEGSKYLLSSKKFKNPVKSYPLQFKPIELNIKFESYDDEPPFFYLYETKDLIRLTFEEPNQLKFAKYFSYHNFLSRNVLRSFFKNYLGVI